MCVSQPKCGIIELNIFFFFFREQLKFLESTDLGRQIFSAGSCDLAVWCVEPIRSGDGPSWTAVSLNSDQLDHRECCWPGRNTESPKDRPSRSQETGEEEEASWRGSLSFADFSVIQLAHGSLRGGPEMALHSWTGDREVTGGMVWGPPARAEATCLGGWTLPSVRALRHPLFHVARLDRKLATVASSSRRAHAFVSASVCLSLLSTQSDSVLRAAILPRRVKQTAVSHHAPMLCYFLLGSSHVIG